MEFVGANALIGPKPSPPGKVSRAARRMRVEEQKRTATRLDECFIPSSVCSALRRSHLPPREGIRCGGDFSPSLRGAQTAPSWQRGPSSVRTGSEFRHAAREEELRGLLLYVQKILRREGFRRDKVRILIKAAEQEAAVVTVGIQHQFDAGVLHGLKQERSGIGRRAIAAGDGSGVDLEEDRRGLQPVERGERSGAVARVCAVEEFSGFVEFFYEVEVRDDAAVRFFVEIADEGIVFLGQRVPVAAEPVVYCGDEAVARLVERAVFAAAAQVMHRADDVFVSISRLVAVIVLFDAEQDPDLAGINCL